MPRQRRQRRSKRIARLTRRGGFLLALGVVALAASYWLGRRELLYLGCFVGLLPLLALAFVRLRPMRLSVMRSFSPPVVSAGHPAIVVVSVGNLAAMPTMEANWRDSWPWQPLATQPARLPSLVPRRPYSARRGALTRLRYELLPPRRGVFRIGPMLVDFSDPFGLADGALTAGSSDSLIVTPDVVALADDIVSTAADEGQVRMLQRRALGGEDDLMTREYRRGDALRRVHWRASAHHGELMVRQEEQRSHAEAHLLLDTRRSHYRDALSGVDGDGPESESFEWAVKLTASLCLHLQRTGFIVQVLETGETQLAAPDRPGEFLESLASVALTDASSGELSLSHGAQRPDRSQGSVFAIISDVDPPTLERLVTHRHSFDLAVAFLVTPRYRALAEPLRAAGWICIPAAPDDPIEKAWSALGAEQAVGRGHS